MAKFVILIEPVHATPRNFPINQLLKLQPALHKYLKNDAGKFLQRDMEATVKNWRNKPKMQSLVTSPYGTRLQLTVTPTGRGTTNWARINQGTGPRPIVARTSRGMRFQTEYDPKTTPSGRYGGPGRKHGPWTKQYSVVHTIAPRKFTTLIMNKREKQIRNDIQKIVTKISRL